MGRRFRKMTMADTYRKVKRAAMCRDCQYYRPGYCGIRAERTNPNAFACQYGYVVMVAKRQRKSHSDAQATHK